MTLKRRLSTVLVTAAVLYVAQKQFRKKTSLPRIPSTQSLKDTAKVKLNTRFIRQLRYILRLCIPSWKCKATGLITLHAMFLVLRTYLSVVVARIDGKLVKDLIAGDYEEFIKGLVYWFSVAIPATFTNSMIRYCQSDLALTLRSTLTQFAHNVYLDKRTYYKMLNLDNRVDSADQLMTADITKFADAFSCLYSNLGKPLLDIVIFNYQLARSVGAYGTFGLFLNYLVTANILKRVIPSFGKLVAEEARLEGEFRTAHSRLITNAEEIAFYHGAERERTILDKSFAQLTNHIQNVMTLKIPYNIFEDFLIKYSWSAVGLLIGAIPVFFPEFAGARTRREEERLKGMEGQTAMDKMTGSRTQGFIVNKRLMISLGDAGGRIMYSYKELNELAGYTHRVYHMLRIFEDLRNDKYDPTFSKSTEYSLMNLRGKVEEGFDGIQFGQAPIVTPAGDSVLIQDLNFEIAPGEHLMITGPNGSGKTSIMRVLAGLWPLFKGKLRKPEARLDAIMYIPQRPYLFAGSLRDQIIYPHSKEQMHDLGYTESDLDDLLRLVYLDYIPAREGGFDAVKEWKDVFSGGEKQRIQMARIFYHSPKFAVLDEATSAVSADVESLLYTTCQEKGITIITISHRPSLFKYHSRLLRVGEGDNGEEWTWEQIGSEQTLKDTVDAEIQQLKSKLEGVDKLRKRLAIINQEMNLTGTAVSPTVKRALVSH